MLTRRVFSAAVFLVPLQIAPRLPQPGVRYVPTPQSVVDAMLELAHVTSTDIVYDLGSGDGRFPITAAVKFGARGVGIEIDRFVMREAEDNVKKAGVADRVRFVHGDLFTAEIGEATVVTVFLLPQMLDQLAPKLVRELRPGTRIVSHQYHFGDSRPAEQTREVNGATIFLWTIGQSLK